MESISRTSAKLNRVKKQKKRLRQRKRKLASLLFEARTRIALLTRAKKDSQQGGA